MSKLSKLASAMPFAHYLGLGTSAAAAAEEDDERKQREGESDEDYAKRMEEMDDEEEKARKAEEEKKEEAKRAEEEKRKEDEAKKAKRADEGDDGDDEADAEEDEEDGKRAGRASGARQRERIRCARIVAAGVKAGRVNQACVLAFDSRLTAAQAIATLNAAALDAPKEQARTTSGLRERMSAVAAPNPGANGGAAPSANPANAMADRIVAAGQRARGK